MKKQLYVLLFWLIPLFGGAMLPRDCIAWDNDFI